MNNKYLAIIPARSGSKRLPNKNILPLAGKPLITWTIEAAIKSKFVNEIFVSTDCEKIAKIASDSGVNVPVLRPKELATDFATTIEVIRHVIDYYKNGKKCFFENIILLQPTSPLRNSEDLDRAIQYFEDKKAEGVISVSECEHSPLWTNMLPHDNSMVNFMRQDIKDKRSQDLPTYYRLNGAIYIWNTKSFLNECTYFLKENVFAFKMPSEKSIDIDTELDFKVAELLMN